MTSRITHPKIVATIHCRLVDPPNGGLGIIGQVAQEFVTIRDYDSKKQTRPFKSLKICRLRKKKKRFLPSKKYASVILRGWQQVFQLKTLCCVLCVCIHDISVKASSSFTYFTERSINHNSQHPNSKQKTQYFMYFLLLFYLRRIAPEIFDCIHGHLRLRQCVVYAPTQCSRIYPLNQQSGPRIQL